MPKYGTCTCSITIYIAVQGCGTLVVILATCSAAVCGLVIKLIHCVGSNILKEKYDKMVDAINSGVVDETKATCKTNF